MHTNTLYVNSWELNNMSKQNENDQGATLTYFGKSKCVIHCCRVETLL